MQAEYNIIGDILAKYPDLNQDEETQLREWRAIDENEHFFQELTNSENRHKMLERFYEIIENEGPYLKRINSLIDAEPIQKTGLIRKLPWWIYTAAASVLIALASYLVIIKNHTTTSTTGNESQPVAVTNDVAPGKYKAKLKLADGSVVYLDSASNKIIGQQGSIAVKSKDGQLIYDGKNTPTTGKDRGATKVLYNTLSTGNGETYATILSDGSKVWLNSQSSVRYPVSFDGDIRKVEITGEAYFEIAPSVAVLANGQKGKRSFVANAPGLEVEVLGTHFDINSYDDEDVTKTTLLEGRVKVRSTANAAGTILQPNEQAQINKQTNSLIKINDADVDAEVAWRFGYFQFNNADLPTVMRQLERWYDVQTVYAGNIPKREFLGRSREV